MSYKPTKGSPLAKSRVEAARNGPRIPVFALALGALAVILLGAIIVVVVAGGDDGDAGSGTLAAGDQAYGPVTPTGDPLPSLPDGEDDPAIGMTAPTLVGETPSGEPVTIEPGEGPMVVAFLAHWCPHCQAEVPRIVALADGTDEVDGVPFVAVLTGSTDTRPNFPPGEWLAREDWPANALVDSDDQLAAAAYGLSGFPFLVALDADGTVVARASGELGDDGLRDFFRQVAPAE